MGSAPPVTADRPAGTVEDVSEADGGRPNGPWDESEIDFGDGVERVDLGGMLIPTIEGIEVQVQVDQASGKVVQVTLTRSDGAVQVQPYAAPRSGGMWEDIRSQLAASINGSGGLVEEATGPFGVELHAQVLAGDGSQGLQPARFVGIDGPRWFLRAVFLGMAARPCETSKAFDEVVRSLVVVRGRDAMPSGAPIEMRLPNAPSAAESAPMTLPRLPERGPEITEIR